MALLDIANVYVAADDADIFKRFTAACLVAARDIRAESDQTPNHQARLEWANVLFTGDIDTVRTRVRKVVRYAIASNSTFQAEGVAIDDGGIQFIVNSSIEATFN
jgi:hypothetical protein